MEFLLSFLSKFFSVGLSQYESTEPIAAVTTFSNRFPYFFVIKISLARVNESDG